MEAATIDEAQAVEIARQTIARELTERGQASPYETIYEGQASRYENIYEARREGNHWVVSWSTIYRSSPDGEPHYVAGGHGAMVIDGDGTIVKWSRGR